MKIAFLVNDVDTELPNYTTTMLAVRAHNLGHDVYYVTPDDFALDPDNRVRARAMRPENKKYRSRSVFLNAVGAAKPRRVRIAVGDLDVLFLRNDPAIEPPARAWARYAGLHFTRVALKEGVLVVNSPNGLGRAANKMYFQLFPEEIRPRTLITRDRNEIRSFVNEFGNIVVKPLAGSGGKNVFLVRQRDLANLNQIIDAVARDGYVIAQEYIVAAENGDTRLFLMNGRPLRIRDKYAAFRRLRQSGDLRANIHAGGKSVPAEIGAAELRIADIVRPQLVADGMFLVGLDIADNKLIEINVFTPGGFYSANRFGGVDFSDHVVRALERKVEYMRYHRRDFNNEEIAVL